MAQLTQRQRRGTYLCNTGWTNSKFTVTVINVQKKSFRVWVYGSPHTASLQHIASLTCKKRNCVSLVILIMKCQSGSAFVATQNVIALCKCLQASPLPGSSRARLKRSIAWLYCLAWNASRPASIAWQQQQQQHDSNLVAAAALRASDKAAQERASVCLHLCC